MVPRWWLIWHSCRGFVYVLSSELYIDSVDHMRTWPSAERVRDGGKRIQVVGARTATGCCKPRAIWRNMTTVYLEILLFACGGRMHRQYLLQAYRVGRMS